MKVDFLDIINSISTFQLLVFIFFLMRRKATRGTGYWVQPNRVLSYFLFVQVALVLNHEWYHLREYLDTIVPRGYLVGVPILYLAAPVFYFYVRSLAFSDFRFRIADIVHAIPSTVLIVVVIWHLHFFTSHENVRHVVEVGEYSRIFWIVYNVLFFFQFSLYFYADFRILRFYREEIRQEYSSVNRINLTWLTVILYGYLFAWFSSVAAVLTRNVLPQFDEPITTLNFLAFFCFFNYIFYKGLSQPEIFAGIVEKQRYEASRLTPDEGRGYIEKLGSYMQNKKPYLNPTLTLKDLATEMSISLRYLSQIINEHAHQNFYDFVNRYRVEDAKLLLVEKAKEMNISEILYAVGFNSKSSFNNAFKEVTGVSPTRFREQSSSLRTETREDRP